MKSAIKCFKATYIADVFYDITTPTKFSQRWVEGFNSFITIRINRKHGSKRIL